jgi:GTP-binding protein
LLHLSVNFLKSSAKLSQCPAPEKPEYAFIGRSNAGKSSLINLLAHQKNLAKTSGRPGKTQLINHFTVDESWYLVDLPGYGYAKVSKGAKQRFQKLIEDYILKRENLVNLFVLLDSRHEPQKIDLAFMEWLGENQIPFAMVFTKTDKLRRGQLSRNLQHYQKTMLAQWENLPPHFPSSAETGAGRTEILSYIQQINAQMEAED